MERFSRRVQQIERQKKMKPDALPDTQQQDTVGQPGEQRTHAHNSMPNFIIHNRPSTLINSIMCQTPLITIRPIATEDQNFVLNQADQFTVFGPYVEVFRRMLNGHAVPGVQVQNIQFSICEVNGSVAGFLAVEWKLDEGIIHGVVASLDFKRRGVARGLINHVFHEARLRGVQKLKAITAETENPAAMAFFRAHGFEIQGVAGTYSNGQRAVHLCRELHPAV
jgi:N-acetylglutamate synthase-like GNAT family acetyltransferase